MKRLLLSGMILLGIGCMPASAQNNSSNYNDDIYYTEEQAQRDAQKEADRQKAAREQQKQDEQTYTSSGNSYEQRGDNRDYANGDEYIDYEDDYYYSSHINRFNYPFYNMGYYSGYYNPFWYDRYWVDPSWGYNPWYRPGFTVSFGYGPYWTSGWGWNSWYGYSGFNSYYNYPYYGGYGGYYGCGAGYYGGYWNGYYAGLYNNNGYRGGYRQTSYGPRYSLNGVTNSHIRNSSLGYRSPLSTGNKGAFGISNTPRSGFRMANGANNATSGDRTMNGRADVGRAGDVRTYNSSNDRNATVSGRRGDIEIGRQDAVPTQNPRSFSNNGGGTPQRERRGFFGGGGNRTETPQQPVRSEGPRFENRSYSQPRTESPRVERSFTPNNSGGRGNGGSNGGGRPSGGGGHSFGGRR